MVTGIKIQTASVLDGKKYYVINPGPPGYPPHLQLGSLLPTSGFSPLQRWVDPKVEEAKEGIEEEDKGEVENGRVGYDDFKEANPYSHLALKQKHICTYMTV